MAGFLDLSDKDGSVDRKKLELAQYEMNYIWNYIEFLRRHNIVLPNEFDSGENDHRSQMLLELASWLQDVFDSHWCRWPLTPRGIAAILKEVAEAIERSTELGV